MISGLDVRGMEFHRGGKLNRVCIDAIYLIRWKNWTVVESLLGYNMGID